MPYSINLNLKTQMKMKTTKYILTIALALVCTWSSSFAVDQSYYSSINGKSGTTLRDALYTIASAGPKNMNYDKLWTAYKTTDVYPADHAKAGKIWDMYGGCTFTYSSDQCGNYDNVCDCYNREHSLPQSWFNKVSPADYDLGHIVPTDGKVNGMRSNYIFGEVGSGAATWGTGKLGNAKSITVENVKGSSTITTTITSTAFEPEDQYKGDFARMYMYMAVRYKHGNSNGVDLAASGDGKKMFNATDANYGLTDYSIALLMKWHRQDPVSKKEIDRNNGMQTVQGNRNPFIDYPDLAEYLWGNHAGETVTLASIDNTFGGEVSSYSISLYRNGETTIINNLSGSYTLPLKSAEDAACTSWAFDGWSATQISETNTKPDYVTTTSSAGIIYAVYAKTTISSAPKRAKKEDVTDDLTRATTGVTSGSTSYSNWSEKTVTSDAVYAGNSAGGNNAIQLRSNNSNSGIVTTASGGKAKKVTVTWHSETAAGRTLNIYGKNSAYSDATDLYSSSQGTLLGTIVKGTSTELTISGDYEYIGMRSSSGAMYLTSVSIMWSSGSGGGSTTYDSDPDDCHCTGNLATPSVTATPSDGTITLTWDNDPNATNGYTVTISKGVGYTTECGDSEIGAVTLSGSKNTCVITGLVNGLEYTTSVVANATSSICESAADEDTATPVGCESWADPTFTYSTPLTAGGGKVTPTIGAGYGTPTFISSNTSVLQVDEEGKVAPISAGTATITAQWPGDGTHCPKDVVSNTITVKGTVVLTFNANYEGADPATATQNFTYGEAQSMTANSFSRTGYTFQGWSTSPSGSKEYDDGASITITAATTLYAVWQVNKHSVTFSQPASGGTFTVNSSSSSPVTNVDFGSTVTITITPTNSYFTVNTVSVSGASGSVAVSGEGTSRTFTMPDEDVTVSVTMTEETKYTVNWYVNNFATPETNYAGETLVGIANPTIDCNGKAFQGWTATANYSSDDTAPGDLFTDASTKTMPINGTSFYAVFATETTSGSGSEGWSQVETLDAITDGTYVIENDGYALPSTTTSSAPVKNSTYALTISNKKITSTVSAAMQWSFAMSEGHVATITNASGDYLYATTANNGLRVGSTSDTWTFELNTSAPDFALYDDNSRRYCASYGTGDDWRSYTTATAANYANNGKVHLFKYSAGSTTTISDYTTSCAAPTEVTVTFHANYEGADPATATQNIPYNTATALTANSFSRTGYTFQGWATSASGEKVHIDGASVTLTSNTHLYAVWQKNSHDVTFTPALTGATVTINGQSTSPQSVEYGETVTIVITPDATYDLSSVSATGVSLSGEGNTRTFTMPDADVTVTVIMTPKPTYAVTWSMDGDESTKVYYEEGQEIAFPTSATGCEDKTFMGWTAAAIANPQAEAPTYVTSATMGTSPITYYAVYAEEDEGGSGEIAKATSISVGDVVYLVYEEDKYELDGISTTSTKYGIGTSYTSTPNKLYPLEVVNGNAEGSVAFKNNDSYLNYSGSSNTLNKNATLSDNTSWTVTFSGGNAIIKNVNNTSRTIRWNSTSGQERFACYTSGMQPVQLYKSSTSYTNYTTTCGAGISAKNIGWITAAKGQKVKRVINVSAKGFDEATTLTASSGDAQFKATLAASAVPAGKTGLSTTLTVEYTPTVSDNRVANVEIVLSAGGITRTITVNGRSLPDEFLAITKKDDTWYALPANMTGGENQYEGVVVTPNDASEPTSVAVAPSTIVYSLHSAANSRYAENGAYVRLAGNGSKALWGNTTADALTIQNSETIDLANAENYEWSLSTTDGIHYTIANPHHADYASGRVLAYSDKYGLYKTSTVFFLVPAGCNSQPQEVNVSARRADATFSWVSNASSVTIDLYTDEGKTAFAKSATATSVPYYMTGLEESTHYWFTLTPEGETACAVSGDFETTGPTIDVVEWTDESVIVSVDKDDEFHPSIVIDGEVEHGAGTGAVATDIFFSKYFEAAASVKLLAVFNGTNANVDLSDYSLSIATNGGTFSHTKFEDIVKKDNTYLTAGELLLESGEELILITYSDTGNDNAIIKCAKEDEENSGFSKYVRIKTPSLEFNGDDVIALKNPDGEFIDLIGASAGSSGDQTNITPCSGVGVSGCDFMDKPGGWYNAHGYQDKGTNAEESNYALATNRCLLIRRNHVTTGRTAVERNTTDFVTLGDYTYEAVNYQGEWKGVQIPGGTSSTTDDGIVNACTGFEHVGGFNYSDYYKGYETIETQTLDSYTHDEATKTYEIPIPDLAKYSCLNIRFQLKNTAGEVVTEAPVQVPIIVKGGHKTIDAIFNEIVKKDDGNPLYDESIIRCKTCDVVVLGTGVLTKATDGEHDVPEVGNVKVYPGGKLIVPEGTSYSVNSLAFRRQEDEVATANIQGDLNIKADGNNVYLDLRIDPSNWHYISLPYNCNVSDIRFADDEVKIPVLGVDYLLKYYDGKKRAATQAGGCWEMVAPDATLKKGIGYIFGIPGTGKVQREFRFPMSNAVVSEEKESTKLANGVYAFGGDKDMTEVRANHRGWNLIGDPYLLPYSSDIEEPVMTGYIVPDYSTDPWDGHYKFDPDPSTNLRYIVEPVDNGRSEYIQVAITDYNMKPFTSYFVQIGGSDPEAEQGVQFNLSKVYRSASHVRRAPAAYEEQEDTHPVWCAVNITSPKGETDETTMLISDQFTDGYDMMDDLVKMRGTYYQYAQITTKPVLASRNNEGEMAFNALPDASAEAGIPLHYFAATQGEYVLAYSDKYGRDEVKAVMLLDKQLNEWHDLMNAPYEFYTNRTDDKDRFVLTIRVERKNGPQITTDIDAASSSDNRPRKILYKDHIYILRGDKIYNITGKEL